MKTPKSPGINASFRLIDLLVPYARNARTHSDEQVAALAGGIEEFGWTNSVLADDKGIVAGHGRVLAARLLYAAGKTIRLPNGEALPPGTVPVVDCTGWSEAKRRAYVLWDNKSALQAGWDAELLALELGDLKALDFDLSLTGFGEEEVANALGKAANEILDESAGPQLGGVMFSIVVECRDESQQAELLGRLEAEGYKCRLLMS